MKKSIIEQVLESMRNEEPLHDFKSLARGLNDTAQTDASKQVPIGLVSWVVDQSVKHFEIMYKRQIDVADMLLRTNGEIWTELRTLQRDIAELRGGQTTSGKN